PAGWAGRYNNIGSSTVNFVIDAICAPKPKRYTITYATADNPPGTQAGATAVCPARTVLLSGGAPSSASPPNAYLTSACPETKKGSRAVEYTGSATAQRLAVFAICAHKPAGYAIVSAPASARGLGTLVAGTSCPLGTVTTGGGIQVTSPQPSVVLGASLDDPATLWLSEIVNWTSVPVELTTYAICVA